MFKNINRPVVLLAFYAMLGTLIVAALLPRDWQSSINFTKAKDALARVTASNPSDLSKEQAELTLWLSKKYRVAPEPMSAIVTQAFTTGQHLQLEPTLILAVMAIESGFNPFAQSSLGAQGLMQVMTKVHTDKYEIFGGDLAAFDPVSNLRVGAKILLDCIKKAGSVQGGLKQYVGATTRAGGGYANKVLAEQQRLKTVLAGHNKPQIALASDN